MSIKILLADDHKIVSDCLKPLINKQPDMMVVGEAENGRMVVALAQKLNPNVVIMDISMPDLNGIEATRQIIAKCPGVRIITLSMNSDRRYVTGMLNAGASGYLTKSCSFEELIRAVRAVAANKTYLSPDISDIVIKESLSRPSTEKSSVFSTLTMRECEVLQMLAEGKTVKQIAVKLCLGIKTIYTHREQIMKKLNIHSTADLTKYALREGMTSLTGG
ncbi:MAG: response regulator [Deltaproteobacteria bacterium]|nr:response regulator transcription factor [Deltaproteobacteria bacterium]NOQ86283.1 response regulator [Deltaproteobacteria bacterium]